MSDDPPGRNDPLMSAYSTAIPALSGDDTGSKWFALLLLGFGPLVSVFGFALMFSGGLSTTPPYCARADELPLAC